MNGNDEAHPDHADHLDSEKSEANTGCHIGRWKGDMHYGLTDSSHKYDNSEFV
jgi:hypothetical protein